MDPMDSLLQRIEIVEAKQVRGNIQTGLFLKLFEKGLAYKAEWREVL